MVRPSNPRFMARVLAAVANLGDTRGSSAREVLNFIRHSNVSLKNLTLKVHRALKHAVNAGLLRHRSGRYKALATLNPTSVPKPPASKESTNNQKNQEKALKPDIQALIGNVESSRRIQERKKRTSRRRNSRHRSNKMRRKSRSSPYTKRSNTIRKRKRTYEDEEFENQSFGRHILHGKDDSPVPSSRRPKRSRVSKRELESDFSDESDCDSVVNRKHVFQANKSLRREPKRKETRAKSRGRSASRTRSSQLLQRAMQARQHQIKENEKENQQCDKDHGSTENNVVRQELHKDIERIREPNDSNSSSTLENSRD
ncbi:hypothetical protein P5V15_011741 [Pogonomyrmex californicus]